MPDFPMPKGPVEKIGEAAKDVLEAGRKIGRRILKKAEAGAEILVEEARGLLKPVQEDVVRLADHFKTPVEIKKAGPIPKEPVKLDVNLEEVHVPNRLFPVTPHGKEIRALLEKFAQARDERYYDEVSRFVTKEEIPTFLEVLRHDDRSVLKGAAAAKLKQLGVEEAVPDLIKTIKSSSPTDNDISFWVTEALVALDKRRTSVPTLIESLERTLHLDPEALEGMEDKLTADLVRSDLVKALGYMKDKRAVPILQKVIADDSLVGEKSQSYALQSLVQIGGDEAIAALKTALLTYHRAAAAYPLMLLGHARSAEVLMQAARTGPISVQVKAVEQLATIALREPKGPVAKFLQGLAKNDKTSPEVKKTIAAVLNPWPVVIPHFVDR